MSFGRSIEFWQQNISQSETRIGDQKLTVELCAKLKQGNYFNAPNAMKICKGSYSLCFYISMNLHKNYQDQEVKQSKSVAE